ncbi:hypothetical protein ACH5RR_032911 [Cinchona calisaya]|uniref:SET domain-containing protein n=1 Tax=Cinchona calisaya TaxID=153742 RepID=A0ABD2YLV7_9GENT
MAPSAKFVKAYKAMRTLGYTQQIVKPVLKNLLVVYNQNWQHIEDSNYSALVEAILDSEEFKEKEQQKFHLVDEPEEDEPPLKRSRLRSQTCSSPGDSSPSSNGTKGTKIQPQMPYYQGEADISASNSSPGSKPKKKTQVLAHHKSDKLEPLSPGTHLIDDGDTYTSGSIVPRMIKERCEHTVSLEEKNVVCDSILSNQKNMLIKSYSDAPGEVELLPDDPSEFEIPLSLVPPDNKKFLIEGDSSNAKEQFSTSPVVINLDAEDTHGSSSEMDSLVRGNCLEYECSDATKGENSSSNSSQIDIASSSSGEVKLSIIFESSLPSNFRVPSVDAVLRHLEENLLKSYRIIQPGLPVINLMKDICEGFLAAATNTTDDEAVNCTDVHCNPISPKELDAQHVLNGNVNHQVGFCVSPNTSMGPIQVQSPVDIRPQIPKFQSLNCLDLSHYKIDVTMKGSYGDSNKNIVALGDLKSSASSSMMIIQKQHFRHDMLSSTYYIDDITRGEEDLEISLINEFNNDHQPMFKYIPKNVTYQSAYVKFLLARISDDNCCSNCFGDCLSSEIPCACAGETGGEFAYMPGGIVKEKLLEDCIMMNRNPQQKNLFYCQECPLERSKDKNLSGTCKGHLVRKFIKECWYKCGCTKDCGNRVVQRGITRRLQVFMTPEGKGWGLRTLEDLPKGAFICEYVGEIVTNMELFERNSLNTGKKHTYPVLLDADWCTEGVLKDEEALCLDATFYGNIARFVNHRCDDANLVEIPVEVETPDHHYYHLAFFTTRNVDALEELTWDYGIDFSDHNHPVKAFKCSCGSQFCRDKKALKSRRSRG